jgi:Outer membrane protein Omp28
MKKQSFTILIAALFLVQGIAQQVEQQQRSLLTKRTATWCPYCGTWGWNYFKGALEQNEDKAIYVAAHYSGNLFIKVADDISNNLGGGYQPRFFLDDIDQNVSSGNVAAKLATLKTLIDDNFAKAPIANSGFAPVFSNGEIKVAAKVKFFQATQGDYYLGVYLLEDNVTAYQASIGDNAVHRFLLRQSFTEDSFGQPITNGDVATDQEFDLNYSLAIDEIEGHDYEVLGIIWKKEGDKYLPVNVWSTDQIGTVSGSGISIKLPENKMTIAPNVTSGFAKIVIEQVEDQPLATLEVLDINGRLVTTLHKGFLKQGYSHFDFETSALSNKGLFFIRLMTPGREIIEKLIVQ